MEAYKAKHLANGDYQYRGLRIRRWEESGYMGKRAYYVCERIPGAKTTDHREFFRLIDWLAEQQIKPTLKIER